MDQINNMLTTIRNGYMAKLDLVRIPHSNFKHQIAKLLKSEGYLDSVKKSKDKIIVGLKYDADGKSLIREIITVSSPGRRIYLKKDQLKPYKPLAGYSKPVGISVVTTSEGVMTGQQAKKKNIGGQELFKIS